MSECLVGVRAGIVGLAAFIDNVVMFDHANRRIGFARGRNCEQNPRKGEAGYTTPDNVFAHVTGACTINRPLITMHG